MAGLTVGALLLWALLVGWNVYDFADPVARQLVGDGVRHLAAVVTRPPHNIEYVPLVGLFIVGCFGPGDAVLALLRVPVRGRVSRIVFALCFGLIAWTLAVLAVGAAGLLIKPALYTLLAIALVATVFRTRTLLLERDGDAPAGRSLQNKITPIAKVALGALIALLAFDLYLTLLGALGPEVEYDARHYHLTMALRYAMHSRIFDIVADTHCICFAQGQYQEILYAATIVLFGLPAAKVVSWAGLLLTIGAIFAFALEFYRSRLTGLVASLLFASTPIVAWSASTASNDLAQAPFALLAVFAFLRWRDDRRAAWLVTSGILCGYDLGIKPFGVALTLVIGVLVAAIAVRERGINNGVRTLAPFALGAFLVALPAIIRSYLMTGDPLFPTITALVHGGRWWWWVQDTIGAFPRRSLFDFLTLPWGMTVDTLRYRDVIGPAYLFALPFVSLGFFTLRAPKFERWIIAILLLWLLLWYPLAPEARYGESILPLAALLFASFSLRVAGDSKSLFAAPAVKATLLAVLVAMTVLNTQLLVPFQRNSYNANTEGLEFISWSTLYENVPDRELELQFLPMVRYIDDHLNPAKDKVFDAAGISAYGLYSDIDLVDGTRWNLHREWDLVSSDAYEHLQEEHIDYVVTFEGYLPLLERAPVFHHLRLVYKTKPMAETGPSQLLWEVR